MTRAELEEIQLRCFVNAEIARQQSTERESSMSTPVESVAAANLATVTPLPVKSAVAPLTDNIIDALVQGDLSKLVPAERAQYYNALCERVGIDPAFIPFSYLILNNKLVLYANKSCAEQLRKVHGISIKVTARQTVNDVYAVTASAIDREGREDESLGAVAVGNLRGDNLANALMKAETKAKRRVTLSICGLGMLDESELETVKNSRRVSFDEKGEPVALGYEPPAKAPTGPEITALYADVLKARPDLNLPKSAKEWAAATIPSYDGKRNPLAREMLEMHRQLTALLAEGADAAKTTATAQETAQDATFTVDAVQTPPGPASAPAGPPAHDGTPITPKTRGHLMGNVARLGWTEKNDRLAYAEQNGLPVKSYNELSDAQGAWLAQRAWDDYTAGSRTCEACGAEAGSAHARGCPEDPQ